jgi:hypothetical protein
MYEINKISLTWKSEVIMTTMNGEKLNYMGMGIIFIIFSLIMVSWLLWPYPRSSREISFEPGEITIDLQAGKNQDTSQLSCPEGLRLVLDWNPIIRKGSTETIHFQVIQNGSNTDGGSTLDSNLDDYSIMLKTRLDMNDVNMDPSGESGVVYSQGNNASFNWKVTPLGSEDLQGTAWFYLDLFPGEGDMAIEKAVSAQNFDIKVISIMGLSTVFLWVMAIIFGSMGIILIKGYLPWKKKGRDLRKR